MKKIRLKHGLAWLCALALIAVFTLHILGAFNSSA